MWKLSQKRLKEAARQGGVHFSLVWGWNVWMTASGTYIPGDHPWHRMEKYGFWVAFVITPVLAQCSSSEQVISKMEILAFVLKRGRELTETGDIFYYELLLLSCAKLWKHHTFTVLLGSRGGIQRWLYRLTRVCWHDVWWHGCNVLASRSWLSHMQLRINMPQPSWTNSSALKLCCGCSPWWFQPLQAWRGRDPAATAPEEPRSFWYRPSEVCPTDTAVGICVTLCSWRRSSCSCQNQPGYLLLPELLETD